MKQNVSRYKPLALYFLALALTACTKTITQDRPVVVKVPVSAPCIGVRPSPVPTLQERFPDAVWAGMDVRQKAGAVGKQVLDRQAYSARLDAATGGCE